MDRPLGRLEHVDPATVWSSEAGDFVPWLAMTDNLGRLGDALGLDLEPLAREATVGRFRADLICRDRGTGALAVIEAQLGVSDHSHLGKLLTYAVGLGGGTAVWLATRFHAEHRAVLDRMNRSVGTAFSCFAVEMRLWKIDASRVAPLFTVLAGPRDRSPPVGCPDDPDDESLLPGDGLDSLPLDENPIRVRRLSLGVAMKQLAEAAGISTAHLSHIETGRSWGSPATRAAIARALAMPAHALRRPETPFVIAGEPDEEPPHAPG